jgi:hypothetical protein
LHFNARVQAEHKSETACLRMPDTAFYPMPETALPHMSPLGCIFLPKGMNKGRLNPQPRGAGWHRRANCLPEHQGLAGRLRFFTRF